jgi:hypothetical protein
METANPTYLSTYGVVQREPPNPKKMNPAIITM